MKRLMFSLFLVVLFIGMAIVVTETLTQRSYNEIIENKVEFNNVTDNYNARSIVFDGVNLTDSTEYNSLSNICIGERNGMKIEIKPCIAKDIDGAGIIQYVNFTWTGGQTRNVSWIFVYDDVLDGGSISLWKNVSYNYNESVEEQAWTNEYLIDNIVSYENLGTPNASCEFGNTNNTKMYLIERDYGNSTIDEKHYCFTDITQINPTTIQVSGNRDVVRQYERTGWREEFKDVSNKVEYMGFNLLQSNKSYYKVNEVEFNPGESDYTKWVYTAKDKKKKGKWEIIGYPTEEGLVNSIVSDKYIYIDPWWNSNWVYKRLITNITANYTIIQIDAEANGMANFSDFRFMDSSESYEIGCWIESKVDGDYARVRLNTTASNKDVYMYYGAVGVENGCDNPTNVYSDNLTRLYNFEEGSGTSATDWVDGQCNLTNWVGATYSTTSKIGNYSGYIATNASGNWIGGSCNNIDSFTEYSWGGFGYYTTASGIFMTTGEDGGFGYRALHGKSTQVVSQVGTGSGLVSSGAVARATNTWGTLFGTAKVGGSTYSYWSGVAGSGAGTSAFGNANTLLRLGNCYGVSCGDSNDNFAGYFDDIMFWNKQLTTQEIVNINNTLFTSYILGGQETNKGISVVLNSPSNGFVSNNNTIIFNATINPNDINISNYTFQIRGDITLNSFVSVNTNISINVSSLTLIGTDGNFSWNVYACGFSGTDTYCGYATSNRTFYIDTTSPILSIIYPPVILETLNVNDNISFNYSIIETNKDSCWFIYGGVTTDLTCGANSSFIYDGVNNTIQLYANDTAGNENNVNKSFFASYQIINNTYSSPVYETQLTPFLFNITYNSSIYSSSNAFLYYNNTKYPSVQTTTGIYDVFTNNLTVPVSDVNINQTFYWNLRLTNSSGTFDYNTTPANQSVNFINVSLCSAPYTSNFLNFTFHNETTLGEQVKATADFTMVYSLTSDFTVNKTFTYSSGVETLEYNFCFNRNLTYYAQVALDYDNAESQQRTYTNTTMVLSNTTYQKDLLLLPNSDGLYITFIIQNQGLARVSDALISITKTSDGSAIESKYTDGTGLAAFWLDTGTNYQVSVTKSGYDTYSSSITPSTSPITYTLTSTASSGSTSGGNQATVNYVIKPESAKLENNTIYTFSFNITSTGQELQEYGFTLWNATDALTSPQTDNEEDGTYVSTDFDVDNQTYIIMKWYFISTETEVNGSKIYYVVNTAGTDNSIAHLFDTVNGFISNTTDDGIMGIKEGTTNGDFTLAIIIFLITFFSAGTMTYKFGITGITATMFVIFSVILFFDVGAGIMPNPVGAVPHFITFLFGTITFLFFVREAITR